MKNFAVRYSKFFLESRFFLDFKFFLNSRFFLESRFFLNSRSFLDTISLLNFRFLLAISVPLLASCNALLTTQPLQTNYYALENDTDNLAKKPILDAQKTLPILMINTPNAAAGFNTRRMLYTRNTNQLEYFAHHEWIAPPANMLQTLMAAALEKTGDYQAVVQKNSLAKADLRLDTEVVKLIQTFNTKPNDTKPNDSKPNGTKPSQVTFTLRATMIDNTTQKVVANREFSAQIVAKSENPVGGVQAANEAVKVVINALNAFSQEAKLKWQAGNVVQE